MDSEIDGNRLVFNEKAMELFDTDPLHHLNNTFSRLFKCLNLQGVEVSLSILPSPKMQQLNQTYRNKEIPADVLSFSQLEEVDKPFNPQVFLQMLQNHHSLLKSSENGEFLLLGDIVLNQANCSSPTSPILWRLIIHGLLHLMGYNHIHEEDFKYMDSIERKCFTHITGQEPPW